MTRRPITREDVHRQLLFAIRAKDDSYASVLINHEIKRTKTEIPKDNDRSMYTRLCWLISFEKKLGLDPAYLIEAMHLLQGDDTIVN